MQTTMIGLHLHGAVFDGSTKQLTLTSQMMDSCAVELQIHPQAIASNAAPAYMCSVYSSKTSGGDLGQRLLDLPIKVPAGLLASQCMIHGMYMRCQL